MGKETTLSRMRRRIWGSTKPAAKDAKINLSSDPTVPPICHETFEEVKIVNSIMEEDEIKEVRRRRRAEAALNTAVDYVPKLLEKSHILGADISSIEHVVKYIPVRYRSRDLRRVYSTATDGCSLNTLYRNIAGKDPIILLIKDDTGSIFGTYVSQHFYPQLHYGGTGETFLFDRENIWEWSRRNKFFYFATSTSLAFGNGNSNAESGASVAGLWLDADLEYGRTGRSDTFNNELLSKKEEFAIVVAEAYKLVLPKR